MEFIEFFAKERPRIRVFLDYEDVTNRAFYARVPREPGIMGDGIVAMYTTYPPTIDESRTDVLRERKHGRVYWIPRE